MSLDNLAKTLKKELVRNKKKSAILGVMCLVAAYFWAPLVWGWFAGDESGDAVALPEQPSVESLTPTPVATPPGPPRERQIAWNDLLSMIEQDQHMTTAELPNELRNPFTVAPLQDEPVEPVDTRPPPVIETMNLAQIELGLELTGIVIGPRNSMATINGRMYRENDRLVVELATAPSPSADENEADDQQTSSAARSTGRRLASEWMLTHIAPQFVVLRHSEGTIRKLQLRRASLAADDTIAVLQVGSLPNSQ